MKQIFFLCFSLITTTCFAQNSGSSADIPLKPKILKSEVSLQYNFGFSNRNFQLPGSGMFERLDHTNARSYYDRGFTLRYNYALLQRGKNRLLLGTGVGYSNSRHYQVLADGEYDYQLETVVFDSKVMTIPLTISYERAITDNRLFAELSYSMNYNMPLDEHQTYQRDVPGKQDFINYTYSLDVRTASSRTHYFAITPKFKLVDNLLLNFSVGYLTSKKISYNYQYDTRYVLTDLSTGSSTSYSSAYSSLPDIEIVDKYLVLSVGVAYKF